MSDAINRREFLTKTALAGLGAAAIGSALSGCASLSGLSSAPDLGWKNSPKDELKVGFVGAGNMGSGHIRNLLKIEGCRIAAVCDIREARTGWAKKAIWDVAGLKS